jgi:membrane fusion protein, multidrug efflux system
MSTQPLFSPYRMGDLDLAQRASAGALARAWLKPEQGAARSRRALRSSRSVLAFVTLLIVVGAGVWALYEREAGPAAAAAPPLPEVDVSPPRQETLARWAEFMGQFSAIDVVELRAQVNGYLTEIHFTDGQVVHKGDLLFVIDPRPYEIALQQALAQDRAASAALELANKQISRTTELANRDFASRDLLDQRVQAQRGALAASEQAKAAIRAAQLNLEFTRITAPFSGRVSNRRVSIGSLISGGSGSTNGTPLTSIVSVDPIHLDFDMSEADYLAFSREHAKQKGALADKVEVALGDETEFPRQGMLDFVDNVLNRSSGTLHARATVPNTDLLLTPGEFARVRLVVGTPVATLLVPDSAVLPDQSEHMVLTVSPDGTVAPKQVQIGDIRGGLRVIRSGLAPTDKVIIEGIPYAAPGSKVAPQDGAIQFAAADGQK